MSIRRNVVALLDRPGGRTILGKLATLYARRMSGADVEAYYDGAWIHRVGSQFFPDGPRFLHDRDSLVRWKDEPARYLENAHDFWFRYLPPVEGEVVIDVGAGHGEDTLAFSRAVGRSGRVIAIEAHPTSFEILRRFCALNGLDNVTSLHAAMMDRPGIVTFSDNDSWEAAAVLEGNDQPGVKVAAATLDDVCRREGVTQVALLKMNIEGAERSALLGMERTLESVRTVCVACHDFRADRGDGEGFRTKDFVASFLAARGFELASRPNDERDYVRDHVIGLKRR